MGRLAEVWGVPWWRRERGRSSGWPSWSGVREEGAAAERGGHGHGALRRGARWWGVSEGRGGVGGHGRRRRGGSGWSEPSRGRGGHGGQRRTSARCTKKIHFHDDTCLSQ